MIHFMLHKKRLIAFHTDLSRIFLPRISCAVFSFPAFSSPAFFLVPHFHVSHFQSPRLFVSCTCFVIFKLVIYIFIRLPSCKGVIKSVSVSVFCSVKHKLHRRYNRPTVMFNVGPIRTTQWHSVQGLEVGKG